MRTPLGAVLCGSIVLALAAPAHALDPPPATATPAPAPSPTPSGPAPSAPQSDVASRAREAFSDGLRLVQAGEYARARAAFERAYELQPHPLALYNIGQCQARLGDYAQAVQTLQRFLDEGGSNIDGEQQRAVTRQIAELRARTDAETTPAPSAPAAPEVVLPAPSEGPALPSSPVPEASVPAAPPAANVTPLVSQAALTPEPMPTPRNAPRWAWWVGASGVALLGSATLLYFWNDGRYGAWKTDRAGLDA